MQINGNDAMIVLIYYWRKITTYRLIIGFGYPTMPRKCSVAKEDVIHAIIRYIEHFKSDLPAFTSQVWKDLSNECNGAWDFRSWYTNVKYNRRDVLSTAFERVGVCPQSGGMSEPDLEEFDLFLTPAEWSQIKPVDMGSKRTNHTLRPRVWTNVIAIAFWKQHRLPCSYVFKRAEVNISSERKYFLKIKGQCASPVCQNSFYGLALEEPKDDEEFCILVKTRNTIFCDHEDVRRPLNGPRREEVGKECATEGCSNLAKKMARQHLHRGDTEGPILPSLDVLRHAKSEQIDKNLGINRNEKQDPVQALYHMQFEQSFIGCIQDVAHSPFFVFYGTPEQTSAYQQYCRIKNSSSKISIDATGSLIQKLTRPQGLKSAHVFLYCIVIHFDNVILSVYQMLSEAQDTEIIVFWLRRWLRRVGRKPKEVVTDYSRALLCACSQSFNDVPLKRYVDKYFDSIIENGSTASDFASTYLRVDVAHLIHMVCRWNCFKHLRQQAIRDFYVRCVALLIDCQNLHDFVEIFELTCLVALQPYENSILQIESESSVKDARLKLEKYISHRNVNIDNYLEVLQPSDSFSEIYTDDSKNTCSPIEAFINKIIESAQCTVNEGTDLNAFYLPDFVKQLQRIGKEFPLWTAVGTPYFADHASSSICEANFRDIKDRVLANYNKNLRVDKFVRIHLLDLLGGTRTFSSKLLHFHMNRRPIPERKTKTLITSQKTSESGEKCSSDDLSQHSSLHYTENWRGKADAPIFHQYIDEGIEYPSFYENDLHENTNGCMNNLLTQQHTNTGADDLISQKDSIEDTDNSVICQDANKGIDNIVIQENLIENIADPVIQQDSKEDNDDYDRAMQQKKLVIQESLTENITDSVIQQDAKEDDDDDDQAMQQKKSNINEAEYIYEQQSRISNEHSYSINTKEKPQPKLQIPCGSKSKFFKACPEVTLHNALSRKRKMNHILPNGNLCKPVKMNGYLTYTKKTCGFDSLVHIIFTAAIDNPHYYSKIEQSNNQIFKFVKKFINNGPTAPVLADRAFLLQQFYDHTRTEVATEERVISFSIDAEDNIRNLWTKLFNSEPSVIRTNDCNICLEGPRNISTLAPNHRVISKKGFSSLEDALQFRPIINHYKCSCGRVSRVTSVPMYHIFIELDIRSFSPPKTETCKISEIPKMIRLGDIDYRLAGFIVFTPGHYIAYCWRVTNRWEIYNDLAKRVVTATPSQVVEPHGVLYVSMNRS